MEAMDDAFHKITNEILSSLPLFEICRHVRLRVQGGRLCVCRVRTDAQKGEHAADIGEIFYANE